MEIRPAHPLYWTEPVEEIDFHVAPPYHSDTRANLVGPNGEVWVPDVQLVGTDGKTCPTDDHGSWGDDMFFSHDRLPDSIGVVAIRIRSKFPIRIFIHLGAASVQVTGSIAPCASA